MANMNDRTIKVLGNDKVNSFENKVILVAGLGGVGGTALEALARTGFTNFILIDFDKVDESNLNRQILYTRNDVGKEKTEVAKVKLLSINPNIKIETISSKIDEGSFAKFDKKVDFIVDAIDFVKGKLEIYKFAIENSIPFISSLGMGNRIDPSKVVIAKLNQSTGDPLARKIRYEAKQLSLDLSKINVVYSKEEPLLKSATPGSIITVPSAAGLLMAKYVIENIKWDRYNIREVKDYDGNNW